MAKIRVHELAKELGIPSKEMVETLQKIGLDVKNHMSTMEESQASWVRKRLGDKPEPIKTETNKTQAPSNTVPPLSRPETTSPRPAVEPRRDHVAPSPRMSQDTGVKRPIASQPGAGQAGYPARRDQSPPPITRPAGSPSRPDMASNQSNQRPTQRPPGNETTGYKPKPRSAYEVDDRQAAPRPATPRPAPPRQGNAPGSAPRPGNAPRPFTGQPGANQGPRPTSPGFAAGKKPFPTDAKKIGDKKVAPGFNQPARPIDVDNKGPKKPGFVSPHNKTAKKTTPVKPQFTKDYSRPQRKGKHKKKKEDTVMQTPELITVGDSIQVRELAEKLAKGSAEIVKKLMELGIMATINQEVDYETVEILASLYDVSVEREISEEKKILDEIVDSDESLQPRSPIVTVMGHVDHGKTSLLDKIRKSDVVSGEAGGITQHIGAYQVTVNGNRITFIDTPGHEAFTAMRARGANLTDIVILVVAADDGVMPQTIEAINHIKAANVPFVVALNKMDKPDVNPDRVMQQLTEYHIVPEEWGGDTMFIPVSAKTGMGIDHLLEMVLLMAEMRDIKANPNRQAEGVVIEGELDKGRGAVATVLVQKGTLRVGDCVICGVNWCKVRAMTDYRARKVDTAYPAMPVEITGWSDVPEVGERVQVCDEKVAKELASLRLGEKKLEDQKRSSKISLDDFFKQMQNAGVKELNLIIKGDVQGSIEALAQSLLRLSTSEVKVNVIHSAVGAVTETDVMLASASNAIIIGFNVRPDVKARKYAEEENIDVRLYRVIYEAIEAVKKAMEGLLDPEYREKYLGRAEVRQTFKTPNAGTIGGSYVIDGKLQRNANIRVLRDGVIVYEGRLSSLRRFKDDAKEVLENYECGIGIKDFNDIKEGDIIEAYTMEEIAREL